MSKTSKIRRMKTQIAKLESRNTFLDNELARSIHNMHMTSKPFRREDPPVFASSDWNEERLLNQMVGYIYHQMDLEYDMAFTMTPYVREEDISFVIYLGYNIIRLLRRVSGWNDLRSDGGILTFKGWIIHEVREPDHCNFVRIK
jgi:hypothetical protein